MKTLITSAFILFCLFESHSQTTPQIFHCYTLGAPTSPADYNQIGYYIDNTAIENNGCSVVPAIIVAVIDSNCHPWNTCEHNFGQVNSFTLTGGTCDVFPSGSGTCRMRPEYYFIYQFNDSNQLNSMADMLDSVPNDSYILAYTWFTFAYSTVPLFKQAFQNLGASQITSLADTVPYIFFIKKGDLSTLVESAGISSADTLVLNTTINCITTSVSEIENVFINIFPNPSISELNISIANGNYQWEIYSMTGQQVLSGDVINGFRNIDTRNLSSGLYVLRLSDEKGSVNRIFGK